MPISCPYQFHQEIEGFQDEYGVQGDNEAIKNMTYMQKKALLVQNFGVAKAKRATASLITNKVEDDGVTNQEGRGVRDEHLMDTAREQDKLKQTEAKNARKGNKYARENLFPEEIISLIPYKQTFEALQAQD